MKPADLDRIRQTPATTPRQRRHKRQTLDRLEAKVRAKRRKVEPYTGPF